MSVELVLRPDEWAADPPGAELVMQAVIIDPGGDGWVVVTGWRHRDEPMPDWERVQVRADALPARAHQLRRSCQC